jgi:O-antigen/teichoic acid export membrane protein
MKEILKRNGISSFLQVLVTGLAYFFLYKYLLASVGVELLGVWSLVLASVASARLSELGFSSSVVKFVAKYRAKGDGLKAGEITETALITVFSATLVVSALAYYPLQIILGYLVPEGKLSFALLLLPYALISLCITTVSGVTMSGLDGCQRVDVRNILLMAGVVINVGLVMTLLPEFGFIALAYAQLIQAVLLLLVSSLFLRKELPSFRLVAKWKKEHFLEIWRYAFTFQLTSFITMTFEPVTKGLLSYFGGLSMVGYYEMASRMVMQVRSLIVSVNRIYVPAVAEIVETSPWKVKGLYLSSYELFFSVSLILFGLLAVITLSVSELWIGATNKDFITFSWLLIAGWMINTLNASAFFFNQGTGNLRPNLIALASTGVLNITLGLMLGFVCGGYGVVAGWAVGLITGSLSLLIRYHSSNKIPMTDIVPGRGGRLLLAVLLALSVGILLPISIELDGIYRFLAGTLVYGLIVTPVVFTTVVGKKILSLVKVK